MRDILKKLANEGITSILIESGPKLIESFNNFSRLCINHFKFIDKSDIIQKDYINIKKTVNKPSQEFNIKTSNQIIMKKKKMRSPKITDHINIKFKSQKKTIIPKKRSINLTDKLFKLKGVDK